LFKLVRELYQEPFVIFITFWHQDGQDIVLHFGQEKTSLLAELQESLSRLMAGAFG
jgi:hypothetical protein